jgi:S-DNA-T family DNA segregation ATPase FtsK/SpoIIIE
MGRKKKIKKDKKKDNDEGFVNALKKETAEGITAIVFIIIAIFLGLARFSKAGVIGDLTYKGLTWLFGIGYYLIPIILVILGVSFIKSLRHNMAWPKLVGGSLMFLTGLGLIDLLVEQGGIIGGILNFPLLKLFGVTMAYVVHVGVMIISTLIIFDLSLKAPHITSWFGRNSEDEEDENPDDLNDAEQEKMDKLVEDADKKNNEDSDDEVAVVAPPQEEAPRKKPSGLVFLSKKSSHFKEYKTPPLSLLEKDSGKPGVGDIKANANMIKRTLANFGIQVEMDEVSIGPSVTRYALKPAEGVKLSRIVALQTDLALALAAKSIRIEAPIPGKSLVGIEIPNSTKTTIGLGSVLKDDDFQKSDKPLTFGVGRGVTGKSYFANLAKMPHLLVAGATGSGKSVTIHSIITGLLYRNSPEMLKFIMVDPKRVELTLYNRIPHLLTPVITDAKKAILALKWAGKEMSRRYDILEEHGVRDIGSYHKNVLEPALEKDKGNSDDESGNKLPEKMPYIVVIIDELADIMQTYPRELEAGIVRLAQMSRAVGIHLIISTQRPSVNVITGLIKANIPARIALQVSSQIDSRTILDMPGAEKLLGAGDMLYLGEGISQPVRVQSPFISEKEVKDVVDFLAKNYQDELPDDGIELDQVDKNRPSEIFDSMTAEGVVGFDDEDDEDTDDLYEEAKQIVISAGKASTSYLQRKLRIGYSRAARIMDILEDKGVIGAAEGSKSREVLIGSDSGSDTDDSEENQSPTELE